MTYRKQFDADISSADAARLKGFIANEIEYFNILVRAFGARLRTMPEIFTAITEEHLRSAVAGQIDRRDRSIPEREHLFYEEVAVKRNTLLMSTRQSMATELLLTYRGLAAGYAAQARALEIPTAMDHRTKRNVQIGRVDCVVRDRTVQTPYGSASVSGQIPDRWDIMILREPAAGNRWKAEFAVKPEGYDYRLTDPVIRAFKRKAPRELGRTQGNAAR